MNKKVLRGNERHFWNPGVMKYSLMTRMSPSLRNLYPWPQIQSMLWPFTFSCWNSRTLLALFLQSSIKVKSLATAVMTGLLEGNLDVRLQLCSFYNAYIAVRFHDVEIFFICHSDLDRNCRSWSWRSCGRRVGMSVSRSNCRKSLKVGNHLSDLANVLDC